jgi:hypothetical protein
MFSLETHLINELYLRLVKLTVKFEVEVSCYVTPYSVVVTNVSRSMLPPSSG